MPAIPLVAAGISAYASSKASSGANFSPEQQSLMDAQTKQAQSQTSLSNYMKGQASSQYALSAPAYNRATSYYSTLLNGNRAAMSQAIAPAAGQLNQVYTGAEKNLERMGVRGGEAATAKADLARQEAGQLGGLTVGVQPGAAAALGNLGVSGMGAATNAASVASGAGNSAANIYSNALKANLDQGNLQYGQGQQAGGNFMSLLVPYLQKMFAGHGSGGGSALPSVATTPGYSWSLPSGTPQGFGGG